MVDVPNGYKMSTAMDNTIYLSKHYNSTVALSEENMNKFILNNYLPADSEFKNKEVKFIKSERANSNDSEQVIYEYRSIGTNNAYRITYPYKYNNDGTVLDNNYYLVIINKIKMIPAK